MASLAGKRPQFAPSASTLRKRISSTSVDGFSRRTGPKGRPSTTVRRACSSRRIRNWRAIGPQIKIGASARRN